MVRKPRRRSPLSIALLGDGPIGNGPGGVQLGYGDGRGRVGNNRHQHGARADGGHLRRPCRQVPEHPGAVDAARPGDWILVAPGDYHEAADETSPPTNTDHGRFRRGPHHEVRHPCTGHEPEHGDRGRHQGRCRHARAAPASTQQNLGVVGSDGKAHGRNGIVVWKADNVSIENLTVCNFLGGAGDAGNEIWWNGGDDSGLIGMHGIHRSVPHGHLHLLRRARPRRRSTGSSRPTPQGPGSWDQIYASNFNDSGMYVGACHQLCDMTIDHAWMEYNALGYSGTNSGGAIVIENSQFDNNKDGVDTNTQIDGDAPAPQNGACPGNGHQPHHPHPLVLGVHPQLGPRQQQPQRAPGGRAPAPGPPAPA